MEYICKKLNTGASYNASQEACLKLTTITVTHSRTPQFNHNQDATHTHHTYTHTTHTHTPSALTPTRLQRLRSTLRMAP